MRSGDPSGAGERAGEGARLAEIGAVYCVQDNARLGPRCSGCPGCPPCMFCQIATGAVRADIADESDSWTSFPPLGPHAPGHMLFIPRRHVRDATVEPALTGTVFAAASAYLGRVLGSDGNLLTSVGAAATQTVEHLHIHVIPRGPDDGLHHDWPWLRDEQETLATVREQRDDVLELLDGEREQNREALRTAWHEGYGAGSSNATDGWLDHRSPVTRNPYADLTCLPEQQRP